ncbi:DNA replication/repair protein RecF [Falsihalocynthiibacter sp. SS001]|uniref:DNA replication/repair protein RecF n=1 Tax=Falsihalocynthiibacter sp. SS001 TaxID=3349698 RepID=UPI0036D335B5
MSLALRELTLSHFRSHKKSRLELSGRPVAIHGANGAGKTSLLEAISLLSPGRGLRRATAQEMTRKTEAIGWKVSATLSRANDLHEIETWSESGAPRQVRIDGKAATQLSLGEIAPVLWLVPSMDRLWIEGAEGRRRFLDRMVLSFLPKHATAVLTYEKTMRERNRLLKDQVRDPAWYEALESQMAKSGAEISANRVKVLAQVSAAQERAETQFPAASLTLVQGDGTPQETTPPETLAQMFAHNRAADIRAGRTLVGPHRADLAAIYQEKDIPARDCSTGEQKALLISLVLSNCRALSQELGTPPLLLLDEVAAHLDAARRAALYDELCAVGAQAFMTGTGAELFTEISQRAESYEVQDHGGTSVVVPTS